MSIVRVAVIGIGNMGAAHARTLVAGEVPGAELVAVCDVRREMESWVSSHLPATVTYWQDAEQMMASAVFLLQHHSEAWSLPLLQRADRC